MLRLWTRQQKQSDMKNFRLAIVDGLIGEILPLKKGRKSLPKVIGPHDLQVSVDRRRSASGHMPVHSPEERQRRCAHCSNQKKERQTHWICTECQVSLCLSTDKNYFIDYHSWSGEGEEHCIHSLFRLIFLDWFIFITSQKNFLKF